MSQFDTAEKEKLIAEYLENAWNYASCIEGDDGITQDLTVAADWFRKAAELGSIEGQLELARAYSLGDGVKKNYAESTRWYRTAAELGDASGQFMVGFAYHRGDGVPKDDTEAAKWFHMAAEQGDQAAQAELGRAYFSGEGVQQDFIQACKWLMLIDDSYHMRETARLRAQVAAKLTPEQVAYALELLTQWKHGRS